METQHAAPTTHGPASARHWSHGDLSVRHATPCSIVYSSRVDCSDLRWILEWTVRCKGIHVYQAFGHNNARNANALFDMVNGHAVQIEFPAAANIAAQGKASAVANERSSLIDSAAYCPHVQTLGAKLLISD